MADYEDVYAPDLTEETESTLSGSEQFVMFDSVEGKRAELSTIADYIVENGEIDGSDIPTIVSTIEGNIGTVDTKVGDLTDLETTDKTDIVSAVNEVNGKAEDADGHVGDLSELETEDKTSAVDAINEVLGKIPVMTKEVTGNPIVVDDALGEVQSLNVELEPVQDLHGYDKPWAAGAGKNKFNIDNLTNTTDITVENGVITVTNNARNSGKKLSQLADLVVGESYTLTAESTGAAGTKLIYLYGTDANISWLFGNTVTITQAYLDALVMFYGGDGQTAQITDFMIRPSSVADASWTPYSNVCPITGHDSVTVGVTGKNQLPKCTSTEQSGVTFTVNDDGSISISGTATDTVNATLQTGVSLRTGTYKYCDFATGSYPSNTAVRTQIYSPTSGTYISTANNQSGTAVVSESLNGANDYIVRCRLVSGHTYNGTIKPMLAYGAQSTITEYVPYKSHSTTVTLPSTVYGGDVDVTGGAGKEKMANIASYNGETINEPWLSSMDEYSPGATPTTGAQVVYTLATPTDLTTTPTDITLYNGDNVVSSDGNMDMVYVRDIVKVIEKLEG